MFALLLLFWGRLFIPGAFDTWELIQAQELHNKLKIKQNLEQLNSDICNITTWLKNTEAELETLKMAEPPADIQELDLRVKRLKVNRRCWGAQGVQVHMPMLAVLDRQVTPVKMV